MKYFRDFKLLTLSRLNILAPSMILSTHCFSSAPLLIFQSLPCQLFNLNFMERERNKSICLKALSIPEYSGPSARRAISWEPNMLWQAKWIPLSYAYWNSCAKLWPRHTLQRYFWGSQVLEASSDVTCISVLHIRKPSGKDPREFLLISCLILPHPAIYGSLKKASPPPVAVFSSARLAQSPRVVQ